MTGYSSFSILLLALQLHKCSSSERPSHHYGSRAVIDWNDSAETDSERSSWDQRLSHPNLYLSHDDDEDDASQSFGSPKELLLREVRRKFSVGKDVFPPLDSSEQPSFQQHDADIVKNPSFFPDHTHSQQQKSFLKTGTTIVGVSTDTCVILAADTRATSQTLVADQRTLKLHPLSTHAAAAGAGTAADLEHVTKACAAAGRKYMAAVCEWGNTSHRVTTTLPFSWVCNYLQSTLYKQKGECQVHLIVGGFGKNKEPCLRSIHPHGSMDTVAYTSLGSGSMAAMAVLEDSYRPHLSMDEAIDLAVTAVKAGIQHDMGSGSQVDVCILRPDQPAQYVRSVVPEEELPSMESELQEIDYLERESVMILPASGVNGFGNRGYRIEVKRVQRQSAEKSKEDTLSLWRDIVPPE